MENILSGMDNLLQEKTGLKINRPTYNENMFQCGGGGEGSLLFGSRKEYIKSIIAQAKRAFFKKGSLQVSNIEIDLGKLFLKYLFGV